MELGTVTRDAERDAQELYGLSPGSVRGKPQDVVRWFSSLFNLEASAAQLADLVTQIYGRV